MLLDVVSKWDNVADNLKYLHGKGVNVDESTLFNQVSNLCSFYESNSKEDKFKGSHVVHKWASFLQPVVPNASTELLKIAQVLFAMPSYNATVERFSFSFMNNFWSDDRNRLLPQSVTSLIMVKFNYKMNCIYFYDMIETDSLLLKLLGVRSEEFREV